MKNTIIILAMTVLVSLSFSSCGTAGKTDNTGNTKAESIIPNKILGCRFGQSKYSVQKKIDNKRLIREKDRELLYQNISFAGTEWDFATFYFNVNKKLQKVHFQRYYKEEERAMNDHIETVALLMMKYTLKIPMVDFDTLKTNRSIKHGIVYRSEDRAVMAWMSFDLSSGGEYLWYNNLLYEDNKFDRENIKKAMKEL